MRRSRGGPTASGSSCPRSARSLPEPTSSSRGPGGDGKKPFAERVRAYAPPGWVERHGRPFGLLARVAWFVCVGWWLGALWTLLAWSVLLLPYPFPELIRKLLADLPSVMTLAQPQSA